MKFVIVVFMCCVVLSTTAYPQSRKNKPKASRQDLPPATPTPVADKTIVSTNTSSVLTVANNSTPSVISSTEAPKAGGSTGVPAPTSVPTTVGVATTKAPAGPTTVAPPVNGTRPDEDDDDEEDEDDNETSEEVDEDIDDQDEEQEGDLLEAPPGAPQPFEEDNSSFEGDESDQEEEEERALDESYNNNQRPVANNKVVDQSEAKVRETSGGIDAYVPGYVTDQGEVLVPIDTLERGLQYTIISDRYVSIPQKKVSKKQQNPIYLYRQEATPVKASTDQEESSEEETPEVIPVKISETSVIFAAKAPAANDSLKEEIGSPSSASSQSSESVEDEDEQTKVAEASQENEVKQVPLGAVPANRPTGEDDEDEVVGIRRSNNLYRRNFYPDRHYGYRAPYNYLNNVYENRRMDYAVDPYSSNLYRSYGSPSRQQHFRFNGPYSNGPYTSEESLEDFGRNDFYDYY